MTRIAVIADVHANVIALDAVLADARSHGADGFWFIGDYSALGPEPELVLDRIADLPHVRCTRGNTDRYIVTGEGPPPDLDAVRRDPSLIPLYATIAASFAWTRGFMTACGRLDWIERLPLEIRETSPAGVRILAVHASPGQDDGHGVHPGHGNAELRGRIDGCEADLVLVGHTHEPLVRRVDGTVVVNVGSVSNPRAPDLRASYVLLELSPDDVRVVHRRVPYDHAAFIAAVERSRHPAADYIIRHQRGHERGVEPHEDHIPLAHAGGVKVIPRIMQ